MAANDAMKGAMASPGPACTDISGGLERTPVSFLNEVDAEQLPYFEYTTRNVPGPGSDEQAFNEVFASCSCRPACSSQCPCVVRSKRARCAATIECSSLCTCGPACPIRDVQHGLRCRLQVFKTQTKGFGVLTMESILRGSYVCSYAGEVISLEVARQRVSKLACCESNYVMVLRENGVVTLVVDPSSVGGVGRFLNHSCEPNLAITPVRAECVVPELALFAKRNISAGEELTYDYSGGCHTSSQRSNTKCACGSKRCFGWLPMDKLVLGF
ncbi:histone-lysine N-methyltransferase SETMAR [Rhipicephalus sanguineus]|nr:histone-lysine N-methyltransferase SETMAR [Rhipicephalus sanguineus]